MRSGQTKKIKVDMDKNEIRLKELEKVNEELLEKLGKRNMQMLDMWHEIDGLKIELKKLE